MFFDNTLVFNLIIVPAIKINPKKTQRRFGPTSFRGFKLLAGGKILDPCNVHSVLSVKSFFVQQHTGNQLSRYLKAPFAVLKTNGSVLVNKETTTITLMLTGKATTIGSM
jgi:hypothetical protein